VLLSESFVYLISVGWPWTWIEPFFFTLCCVYNMLLTSLSWLSMEPGECSLYTKWLRAWRPRNNGSLPGRSKEFRAALMPTQPPIWRVSWALWLRLKRPRRAANHWPQFSAKIKELVELYLHFHLRFHGVRREHVYLYCGWSNCAGQWVLEELSGSGTLI